MTYGDWEIHSDAQRKDDWSIEWLMERSYEIVWHDTPALFDPFALPRKQFIRLAITWPLYLRGRWPVVRYYESSTDGS